MVKTVASANARFGHDLHNVLAQAAPNSNLVHSPFSLSVVLAMVKHGARNQTSLEIERVCHFPKEDESLASGYNKLLLAIQDANKDPRLELAAANRLYAQHGFPLKPEFSTTLQKSYLTGEIQQLDFGQAVQSAKEINEWVEKVTKNKIKDLISSDVLSPDTRLVLVNGVYFKGIWKSPFQIDETTKSDFQAIMEGGSMKKVQVDMMHIGKKFLYTMVDNTQVVALPYQGDQLVMLIFLPKEASGLQKLQEHPIDHESLFEQMNAHAEIDLSMPRFKVESTHKLVEPLKKMGLTTAFSDGADFSGITGDDGLSISEVVQKAFIEVNEEGTEAAAATGMRMIRSTRSCFTETIVFYVNRPFQFQIIHKPSYLVLFSGCVKNPTA